MLGGVIGVIRGAVISPKVDVLTMSQSPTIVEINQSKRGRKILQNMDLEGFLMIA